jgi:hypothetical protein
MGKTKNRKKINKDVRMMTVKGFMQMFSIGAVGSGGFSHSLDAHLDTHTIVNNTDYGKQSEARDESKDGSTTTHFDRDQSMHIYQGGTELASNGNDRNNPHDSSGNMYDNT